MRRDRVLLINSSLGGFSLLRGKLKATSTTTSTTTRQPSYHGTAALSPQPYTSSQATAFTCRPTATLVAYWIT